MKVVDNIKFFINNAKPAKNADTKKTKKVLIVDDEAAFSTPLGIKLKTEGYDVLKAYNGQEGLNVLQSNNPDLIVLDIIMPIMNGKVMIEKLRQLPQYKTLPVIMLSNEGEYENIKQTEVYYSASK